jgi:Ni,Fe-hydrogenase III small subunit
MEDALRQTYEAMPDPKWVLAVGDCAACSGLFGANYAVRGPVSAIIPVDAVVTGCPPEPLAIMRGLLQITSQRPA